MAKQVMLKGNVLHVRTSEDYESANKVICLKQGKKAKVFYPFVPNFTNDLDEVKDFTICGYKVVELLAFAESLRDKQASELDLKDYNGAFIAGYQRAQDDIRKQIEDDIQRMFDDIKQGEEA